MSTRLSPRRSSRFWRAFGPAGCGVCVNEDGVESPPNPPGIWLRRKAVARVPAAVQPPAAFPAVVFVDV